MPESFFRVNCYDENESVWEENIMHHAGCSKHKASRIRQYIVNNWVSNADKSQAYWDGIDLMHDILERMNYGVYKDFNMVVNLCAGQPFMTILRDELDVTDEIFTKLSSKIYLDYTVREVLETIYDFFTEQREQQKQEVKEKEYSASYNEFFDRTVKFLVENTYDCRECDFFKHLLLSTVLEDHLEYGVDLENYYESLFDGYHFDSSSVSHISTDYCFGDVYRVFKKEYLKGPISDEVVDTANKSLKERNAKIIDLHNSGLSQQKIADKLHMARSTVGDIIRKHKATADVSFQNLCEEQVSEISGECVVPPTTHNHQWVAGYEFITCYLDGIMYTADKNHPNFKQAFDILVEHNDVKAAVELINIKKTIEKYCDGDISIEGSTIRYKDIILDTSMTKRIIQNMREGREFKHLVRFLGNLVLNPRREAVYELFDFLENSDIEISEDGYFIAYKRVRPTYMDIFSNTFDNSIGAQPTMEPFEVDPDRDNECSRGLHVGSWGYMPCYSSCKDDRIIRCKVNPAHVVSVPRSYNAGKLRTWTYKVIEDVTEQFKNR